MSIIIEENDSDLEVEDSGSLRSSYFRLQLKLILELQECQKRIPCRLLEFEKFVEDNINWKPSPQLVHSTWLKLKNAEEEANGSKPPTVEISDDDVDIECSINNEVPKPKQSKKKMPKPRPQSCLKSESANINLVDVPSSPEVILLDEEELSSTTSGAEVPKQDTPRNKRNSNSKNPSLNKKTDKPSKKRKRRDSAVMTEEEAEKLREQLLIDKIIELELPKVLKSVMQDSFVNTEISPDFVSTALSKSRKKKRKLNC